MIESCHNLFKNVSSFSLDGETVLNALKQVFYDPPIDESCDCEPQTDLLELPFTHNDSHPRRTSGASSVSGNERFLFTFASTFLVLSQIFSMSHNRYKSEQFFDGHVLDRFMLFRLLFRGC